MDTAKLLRAIKWLFMVDTSYLDRIPCKYKALGLVVLDSVVLGFMDRYGLSRPFSTQVSSLIKKPCFYRIPWGYRSNKLFFYESIK